MYPDLIGPETKPRLDGKIQLEAKEDMKRRGIPSPNRADALALTFAMPVMSKDPKGISHQVKQAKHDFDPYKGEN